MSRYTDTLSRSNGLTKTARTSSGVIIAAAAKRTVVPTTLLAAATSSPALIKRVR
jgi:hypothetical protein